MITVTFNSNVWAQERTILHVADIAAVTNYVQLTIGTIIAKYYGDTTGALDVDVSDIVRMSSTGTMVICEYNAAGTAQGSAITKTWTVQGLINPANMIIPYADAIGWMQNEGFTGAIICPPTTCIENSGGVLAYSKFEIYPAPVANYGLTSAPTFTSIQRSTQISAQQYLRMYFNDGQTSRVFNCTKLQKQLCDRRYCLARWTSRSGVQKQNVFEVRDVTNNSTDKTEFLRLDNEYQVTKGQEQTLKLCIDNLTDYDYWYYSDMLTSSSVEVSMNGTNWVKVKVTDKGATIPNGNAGEFYSFVANVNYRRYDEV